MTTSTTGALVKTEAHEIQQTSPMMLLQLAIEKQGSIDVIERLAKLQREEREYQAKVDFDDALNRCQQVMRRISADANNPQTRSRYATYAKMDSALRPLYSKEGFSLSFSTEDSGQADVVLVTCLVSRAGHERKYQIPMPADGKGAKGGDVMTKTHATGAAATYGMRYLLKMIFNVAIGEDDTDGNMPTAPEDLLDESIVMDFVDSIEGSATPDELKRNYQAAQKAGAKDASALKAFDAAKRKTWFEKGFNK